MTTQITEVLMGLGSFDIGFKHNAELVDPLSLYDHVLVYEGEQIIYTGVLLRRKPAPGAAIGGFGIDWWLGQDSDGPIIEDREYIAGTNKLSNGSFEDQGLLWRVDEDPLWVFRSVPGEPFDGDWVAAVDGVPVDGELLQSNESFECRPGDQLDASVRIKREDPGVYTRGRLQIHIVFSGRFRHGNSLQGKTWTDTSTQPGDADEDATDLILGPVTRRQSIINSNFEDESASPDAAHWYDQDGPAFEWWDGGDFPPLGNFQGDHLMVIPAFGAGGRALLYDHDAAATPPVEPIDVVPGEKIHLQIVVTPWSGPSGGPYVHADGRVYAGVLLVDVADANPVFFATDILDVDAVDQQAWTLVSVEFEVPESRVRAHPFIQAYDVATGAWGFDAFTFTHLERNEASLESSIVLSQHSGRRYKLLALVTSDASVTDGNLKARIRFTSPPDLERDDVIIESPTFEPTGGVEKLFSFEYEVPSGYTASRVGWVATDVQGGSFRVRKSGMTLTDTDEGSRVRRLVSDPSTVGFEVLAHDFAEAPEGAERVYVEVLAEEGAAGWVIDDVSLSRRETPDAAAAIVDDLFRDPDTGEYLVPPGTIHSAGTIVYDWRIRNLTNREALKHLSWSGLVAAAREWKVNGDATVDWGTADELFVDRSDFVLSENDLILRSKPTVTVDASSRPTNVKLVGADRTPVGGQKQIITGLAAVDPGGAVDWFGNPVKRTRIVEESTVETAAYANGRAELELAKHGAPADGNRFDLADWRVAGRFDVGDTIYAYVPAAGLVDETNPVEVDGRTIWPAGKRVLSRTRKLGEGQFRVEIRAADGTVRDVTEFVEWENETSADVQLGDALPEFVLDPQGGAAGAQFRRFRGSTGR